MLVGVIVCGSEPGGKRGRGEADGEWTGKEVVMVSSDVIWFKACLVYFSSQIPPPASMKADGQAARKESAKQWK